MYPIDLIYTDPFDLTHQIKLDIGNKQTDATGWMFPDDWGFWGTARTQEDPYDFFQEVPGG